jgi:hypothetical protein
MFEIGTLVMNDMGIFPKMIISVPEIRPTESFSVTNEFSGGLEVSFRENRA